MNPIIDEAIDFIFERARDTKAVMITLGAAPYNWAWTGGVSPGNFGNQIEALDDQLEVLNDAEAVTSTAAAQWDHDLDLLLADAVFGSRLARVKYKSDPVKLQLFEGLRHGGGGRDVGYKQALDFESSWRAADPAWVFQAPLTLALFKQRRESLRTREEAHVTASKAEQKERAYLHVLANDLNGIAVDWYEVASATFAENTVPGALVRTIPTTYDPNRPPGALVFTEQMSAAPNQARLVWRAPRGEKFTIKARGPNAAEFQVIVDAVTDKEWIGLGLASGQWSFEGFATNQFGQGPTSEVVHITVAAAAVA
jgi:hypothetical protein